MLQINQKKLLHLFKMDLLHLLVQVSPFRIHLQSQPQKQLRE